MIYCKWCNENHEDGTFFNAEGKCSIQIAKEHKEQKYSFDNKERVPYYVEKDKVYLLKQYKKSITEGLRLDEFDRLYKIMGFTTSSLHEFHEYMREKYPRECDRVRREVSKDTTLRKGGLDRWL